MRAAHPSKVVGVLAVILLGLAGFVALSDGFYFSKHETDTVHLVQIVFRMSAGQVAHLDFMTPLGAWGFEPFALLVRAGMGIGHALLWGQIIATALMFPAVCWAGISRLSTGLAIGFGAVVLALVAALVYGGVDGKLSMSMHYNRWAWAVAFVPLLLVALPGRGADLIIFDRRMNGAIDGLIIGVAMAVLVMIKVTYFVAFAPAIIVGLLMRKQVGVLALAVGVGIAILAGVTAAYGIGYWHGYVADLLAVMGSDVRAAPGAGWAQIAISAQYGAATILAVFSVVILRKHDNGKIVGAVLALILPGAIYVSYQNFGNDPIWLILWGFVLLGLDDDGHKGVLKPSIGGVVAFALIMPVAANILFSPARHLTQPKAIFAPMLTSGFGGDGRHTDLRGVVPRMNNIAGKSPLDRAECQLAGGAIDWMRGMADAMERAGLNGAKVYTADLFNAHWVFGDFAPLPGGAPWYYGGLPGFGAADVLVVPKCPIDRAAQGRIMELIEAHDITFTPIIANEMMDVYRIQHN